MGKKTILTENDQDNLRRSGRKRYSNSIRMDFFKNILPKMDRSQATISKTKGKDKYKRIRTVSSDAEDSEPTSGHHDENALRENGQIRPKRLKFTRKSPEPQSLRSPTTIPTIVNPMETPETVIPMSMSPTALKKSPKSRTSSTSKKSQSSQTPTTSKTPATSNTNITQDIVVNKLDASIVTWVNDKVCTFPLTSNSSMIMFQGESADYFWQSPIGLNFTILQGRFNCRQIGGVVQCGDQVSVPSGKGIQFSLMRGFKDGRILCFIR